MFSVIADYRVTLFIEMGENLFHKAWEGIMSPGEERMMLTPVDKSFLQDLLSQNLHKEAKVIIECIPICHKSEFFITLDEGPLFGGVSSSRILAETPGKTVSRFIKNLSKYIQDLQ